MWTLSEIRDKLSDRLGEDSTVFWSDADRDNYINEAQRFVAAVTKGIPKEESGSVDSNTRHVQLPARILNFHAAASEVDGGRTLPSIDIRDVNWVFPSWRTVQAKEPRWVVLDLANRKAYPVPIPSTATTVNVTVSVLPDELTADSDELFNGVEVMEQYQGVVLNVAAALALLKERYDGDAERFFQFAIQELQQLGISPNDIPNLRQVSQERDNGS